MSTSLDSTTKKRFRTIGHKLHPVVTIAGNGMTANILDDIDLRLEKNELIKIKIAAGSRESKKQIIQEICDTLHAIEVQHIGNVVLLYRTAEKQNPKLSNLIRNGI